MTFKPRVQAPRAPKLQMCTRTGIIECGDSYRLGRFLRTGFQAPDDAEKTRFTTYSIRLASGVDAQGLLAFFRGELGIKSMPTLLAEVDGQKTLSIFQAAEEQGLLVLTKLLCGAPIAPQRGYSCHQ